MAKRNHKDQDAGDGSQPETVGIELLNPVKHDGQHYGIGAVVECTPTTAQSLIDGGDARLPVEAESAGDAGAAPGVDDAA